jgi:asparagine synthase (glutamine-hydrolysing)
VDARGRLRRFASAVPAAREPVTDRDELLWRAKAEFGDGSGARDVLSQAVEATVSDEEFEAERGAVEPALRTKEEVAYYRVWRERLQGISPERTLSRFARA